MRKTHEICAMYRRSYSDPKIIKILADLYMLDADEIKEILKENGLMTEDGKYNAPLRMTGNEFSSSESDERLYAPKRKYGRTMVNVCGCSISTVVY